MQLSDNYQDQSARLEKALLHLFSFDSLLTNQYLIDRLLVDPYDQSYSLHYNIVQKEKSVISQYVHNDANSRAQYHSILLDVTPLLISLSLDPRQA